MASKLHSCSFCTRTLLSSIQLNTFETLNSTFRFVIVNDAIINDLATSVGTYTVLILLAFVIGGEVMDMIRASLVQVDSSSIT